MKKLAITLSLIIFSVSISACSSNNDTSQTIPSTVQTEQTTAELTTAVVTTEKPTEDPDLIEIPDVVGLHGSDATEKLKSAGLEVETVLSPSETVQADYVISQSPEAGKKVKKNETVTVYLSKTKHSQSSVTSDAIDDDELKKLLLDNRWTLFYVISDEGKTIDPYTAYGSILRQTGSELSFNSDGTFKCSLGFSGCEGTYYIENGVINVEYEESADGSTISSGQTGQITYAVRENPYSQKSEETLIFDFGNIGVNYYNINENL